MRTYDEELNYAARNFCRLNGLGTYGMRGRTDKCTYACWSTPVEVIPEVDDEPSVKGLGFWKTVFNNGRGFRYTLYTPSTFHITVGENWIPSEIYLPK